MRMFVLSNLKDFNYCISSKCSHSNIPFLEFLSPCSPQLQTRLETDSLKTKNPPMYSAKKRPNLSSPFPAAYRKASEIIDKGTVDECRIVVDIVLLKYEDFFFDRRIYGMIRIDISYRTQLEITCQDGQDCKNCIVGFRGFMG